MEYISKSALVAEIENLENTYKEYPTHNSYEEGLKDGRLIGYKDALHKINTLEVKEVDLETSIDDYINSHFTEGCDGGMISDWYKVLGGVYYKDLKEIAKHFFELGLKAQEKIKL